MSKHTIIKEIALNNFRCYEDAHVVFSKGVNIIGGINASGKTSIVEAVYVLAMTKSFRTTTEEGLFGAKGPEYLIKGVFEIENCQKNVILLNSNNVKRIRVGHNVEKKVSSYIGEVNVVAFSPDDVEMILGTPATRRYFFDSVICQTDKEYLLHSVAYKRLLKDRNKLLKQISLKGDSQSLSALFDVITEQLCKHAQIIINKRVDFLPFISQLACKNQKILSANQEVLDIKYAPSCVEKCLKDVLFENKEQEIRKGVTLFGPHRDDYLFSINQKDITIYASQGQRKSCAISCRLACVEYITHIKGCLPIVILDDVFSELDKNRQNALLHLFEPDMQVIITTATLADIDEKLINNAHLIFLKERKITYGR